MSKCEKGRCTPHLTICHDKWHTQICPYRLEMLNKHIEVGKLQIQTPSWRVSIVHTVYVWAPESMRCMPAGLCSLHHNISAWPAVRSAWGLLFYITALHFSLLLLSTLLWLCIHFADLSTFPSLLCAILCQAFLLSNFYRLTNAVRWSWLACALHKQPACSHHGLFKTPQPHCHTLSREIKHTQHCRTSNKHIQRDKMPIWEITLRIHTHTDAHSM